MDVSSDDGRRRRGQPAEESYFPNECCSPFSHRTSDGHRRRRRARVCFSKLSVHCSSLMTTVNDVSKTLNLLTLAGERAGGRVCVRSLLLYLPISLFRSAAAIVARATQRQKCRANFELIFVCECAAFVSCLKNHISRSHRCRTELMTHKQEPGGKTRQTLFIQYTKCK